ncbi:SWIM-type domain-containing protein [Abeliophyllum distichum]|uniref:SWIM-type domain-containing protein n=1 Tax=Abeliophyllum distichum TaxID=126358 RepID=A0ABD1RZK2_9LAMI
MFIAAALDANDCIYPIAFAIVENDNIVTWRWFIRHLSEDIGITNSNKWTFMSDRHKGLYVKHMYTNFFRTDFKGLTLKEYLWRAAKSTKMAYYKFWMKKMEKENKSAYERRWDLTSIPCGHTCAAILNHFDDPQKYVHLCYLVNNYMSCYENIVMPINRKKLWPEVDAMPIQASGWYVPMRRRKQKKMRMQQEEDVIMHSVPK